LKDKYKVGVRMPLKLSLHRVSQRFLDEGKELFQPYTASIREGSRIACTGASGQGKSSLLKILARLHLPASGTLSWNDQEATEIPVTNWRRYIHYVAQHATMLSGSIEDNLKLPRQLHQLPFDKDTAEHLLDKVGLSALDWKSDALQLSGGEQQRLALVRSLLLEPQVLLLDEVTASLDEAHTHHVEELLKGWAEERDRAYVWITHQPDQIARIANEQWSFDNHVITSNRVEVTA